MNLGTELKKKRRILHVVQTKNKHFCQLTTAHSLGKYVSLCQKIYSLVAVEKMQENAKNELFNVIAVKGEHS